MNYWAMAFPGLVYLASFGTCSNPLQINGGTWINVTDTAMGVTYICQASKMAHGRVAVIDFATSYFLVSLSLSILLTLMIVARLILHRRNLQKATGTLDSPAGLYTTVITMLIESYAFYVVTFLVYIVPWEVGSKVTALFSRLPAAVQVCAIFAFLRCTATFGYHSLIVTATGHRPISHYYTSCKPESIDERHDLRNRQFNSFQEPMYDGW